MMYENGYSCNADYDDFGGGFGYGCGMDNGNGGDIWSRCSGDGIGYGRGNNSTDYTSFPPAENPHCTRLLIDNDPLSLVCQQTMLS